MTASEKGPRCEAKGRQEWAQRSAPSKSVCLCVCVRRAAKSGSRPSGSGRRMGLLVAMVHHWASWGAPSCSVLSSGCCTLGAGTGCVWPAMCTKLAAARRIGRPLACARAQDRGRGPRGSWRGRSWRRPSDAALGAARWLRPSPRLSAVRAAHTATEYGHSEGATQPALSPIHCLHWCARAACSRGTGARTHPRAAPPAETHAPARCQRTPPGRPRRRPAAPRRPGVPVA